MAPIGWLRSFQIMLQLPWEYTRALAPGGRRMLPGSQEPALRTDEAIAMLLSSARRPALLHES